MKPKIIASNHEVTLADDEFIVSKTDTKGRITYVNRTFMRIADYRESQLLGAQHNIIRHPDMPRGVFRFLWQTLQQGNEFFGFVKNLTANGSYYWVFANVTPDYDSQGQLKGYFSVRRKPPLRAIETVEPLYQEMLKVEAAAGSAKAPDASIEYLQGKLNELDVEYEPFVLDLYDRG